MADRRRNLTRYDADRPSRDASRRARLDRDVRTVIGILTDVTEAVELVSITNPPPDPDRRCIVCGAIDCSCPQPGYRTGGRSSRPADPTHVAWVRIEQGVVRARLRYLEVLRAVEQLADQFGLDFDDRLEPIATTIDPTCSECGPDDDPLDCTHHTLRAAWLRPACPRCAPGADPARCTHPDRHRGPSTVTVAFRQAATAIHQCLDDVQDVWLAALGEGESETTLQWTARSVSRLRAAAQQVLDALVAPRHPDAGKRPDPCGCDGTNCDHWPGECDNLPDRRTKCSSCRSRDRRTLLKQEGAA